MAYLGILLAVYALLITPLHLRLDVAAGMHMSGAVVLHIWGFRIQANVGMIRDEQGLLHLALRMKGSKKQHSGGVDKALRVMQGIVRVLRKTNITKTYFRKTLSVLYVSLKTRIGFADAVHTALAAGAASAVLDVLRHICKARGVPCSIVSWPDFTGKPCAAQLTCILFIRLGNLLLGCAMAGFAVWSERRRALKLNREEENAWNTPSET